MVRYVPFSKISKFYRWTTHPNIHQPVCATQTYCRAVWLVWRDKKVLFKPYQSLRPGKTTLTSLGLGSSIVSLSRLIPLWGGYFLLFQYVKERKMVEDGGFEPPPHFALCRISVCTQYLPSRPIFQICLSYFTFQIFFSFWKACGLRSRQADGY